MGGLEAAASTSSAFSIVFEDWLLPIFHRFCCNVGITIFSLNAQSPTELRCRFYCCLSRPMHLSETKFSVRANSVQMGQLHEFVRFLRSDHVWLRGWRMCSLRMRWFWVNQRDTNEVGRSNEARTSLMMLGNHKDIPQRWCFARVSKRPCPSMIRTLQNSALQHVVPCAAIFCLFECSFSASRNARIPESCTATFDCCIATFGWLHCSFCSSCNCLVVMRLCHSFLQLVDAFCSFLSRLATFGSQRCSATFVRCIATSRCLQCNMCFGRRQCCNATFVS